MGCLPGKNIESHTTENGRIELEDTKKELKNEQEFEKILEKSYSKLDLTDYEAKAYVVSCYDGDTIKINMMFKGCIYLWNCRFFGLDAYEIKAKRKNKTKEEIKEQEEIKSKGLEAKEYVQSKINRKIIKVKCKGFDLYGRLLILVFNKEENNLIFERSLNKELLDKKLAVPMDSKGRKIK